MSVQIGEKVRRHVFALGRIADGVVDWIHPAGRFFVVRFELPGGTIRESYRD